MKYYFNLINKKILVLASSLCLNTIVYADAELDKQNYSNQSMEQYTLTDHIETGYTSLNLVNEKQLNSTHLNIGNKNQDHLKQTVIKYITNKYKNISYNDAYHIAKFAFEHAENNNIDPTLLLGIIEKESSFQKHITSRVNAQGLMQVVPKWHKKTILKVVNKNGGDIKSINNNIEIGTSILKNNLQKYRSIPRALQAYNGSHNGTSYSKQVLRFQNNIKRAIESRNIAL